MQTVKFIKSSPSISKCPQDKKPEFAFIGRSNVGKSSLINMLAGKKNLAKISGKPGKTQLINHFLVDESWYLVDLPGYGYAKVSKSSREQWEEMTFEYLKDRESLYCIFVLIDARHEPLKQDLNFINWLAEKGLAFIIVFTKADKPGKQKLADNLLVYKKVLEKDWEELPLSVISSSKTEMGKKQIIDIIEGLVGE